MRKSNLTYDELIELAPKDRPFQIEYTTYDNKKDILWASIVDTFEDEDTEELFTDFIGTQTGQYNWSDDEYINWKYSDITFTLIDEYRNMYEKPEVLEVRTEVEILKNAKEIEEEEFGQETYIGKIGRIQLIQDDYRGLWYGVVFDEFDESNRLIGFPHYCVRPVEKVEEIITVNGKKYKLIEE